MPESVHVGDKRTIIYINVTDSDIVLDTELNSYPTRTVRIRRPVDATLITITAVPVELDSQDDVRKLKLMTGSNTGTTLTGTGDFVVPATETGDWLAEVFLADEVGGEWTSDTFILLNLKGNLS